MLNFLQKLDGKIDIESLKKYKLEKETKLQNQIYDKYKNALSDLPIINDSFADLHSETIAVKSLQAVSFEQRNKITNSLKAMIPWRKGPFNLFDITLDAEWRSDHKWQRIKDSLGDLSGQVILDVGCNNGYFLFKMAASKPKLALGIDPVPHVYFQYQLLQHYLKQDCVKFELFGINQIEFFEDVFDTIFHMGIIYHHRHPLQQLIDCKKALKLGGTLVLETIGIPGTDSIAIFPKDRYANMRNVWFVPTLSCLINWVKRANFDQVEIISDTLLTSEEQRKTDWCPPPYQSLEDFIDPTDPTKTIEGLPAPRRFCIKAKKLRVDG
jgi:tRNA (mo5U34)-methyltransferase